MLTAEESYTRKGMKTFRIPEDIECERNYWQLKMKANTYFLFTYSW